MWHTLWIHDHGLRTTALRLMPGRRSLTIHSFPQPLLSFLALTDTVQHLPTVLQAFIQAVKSPMKSMRARTDTATNTVWNQNMRKVPGSTLARNAEMCFGQVWDVLVRSNSVCLFIRVRHRALGGPYTHTHLRHRPYQAFRNYYFTSRRWEFLGDVCMLTV